MDSEYLKKNYSFLENEFAEGCTNEDQKKLMESWFTKGTVDWWRHDRMYNLTQPLLGQGGKKWATIGDGRFGLDANSIQCKDQEIEVTATNIDDTLLKIGKEKGIIDSFSKENAEMISFGDEHFDYVVCKEALHHFPRPAIGLYEMLRVAKEGVMLIEPNDRDVIDHPQGKLFDAFMSFLRKLRKKPREEFEPVGNYIYSISQRDIEKVAWALRYPMIAYKKINDHYIPGGENELADNKSKLWKKLKFKLWLKDMLCLFGLMRPVIIGIIIFKSKPSIDVLKKLNDQNYTIKNIPHDPYQGDTHPF